MPQLKQLSCCIQWSDTNAPFQEHGTLYGDGVVETFIIVPNKPQGFSIHLTSRGFISEGIVMIVFIDGNYQCNRSRVNLLPPAKDRPANRTEIDFLLRQKEKPQGDGIYLGREWRFDNHNIVAESPEGFQESHFDDLGMIEVLVLRCRARNREDADYEGSSSGEDSDIFVFGERPFIEEQGLSTDPSTVSAPAPQGSAVPEPPAAEDGGIGLMGFLDGANDPPNPPPFDGGNDGLGRWIWHQNQPPFAGFPEPPQYHQPEGYRFRSQSYAQPPHTPRPQSFHDRRSYSGQPPKRVHFDHGNLAPPPPISVPHPQPPPPPPQPSQQQDMHRRFSHIHQPQPQRPVSRVRERWPSKGSQTYSNQSHDSQRNDRPSNATEWHDASENHNSRQTKSPRTDDPPRTWGYGNGNAQRNDNGRGSYTDTSNNYNQPQQSSDQGRPAGQQSDQRRFFGSRQSSSESAPATNSSTPPAKIANQRSPGQNMRYDPQSIPHRNSSAHSRQPSHPEPVHSAPRPQYTQHAMPGNETQHRLTPSSYVPTFPHHPYPYPHPPQMQPGYYYGQPPYPGHWPVPYPGYDLNNAGMYPGRLPNVVIYPSHMVPPGSSEQISPTNVSGNGYSGSNGNQNDTGHDQEGYGGSQGGQQGANGDGNVNQSWQNDSTNNDNGTNWGNGNDNAANRSWSGDQNDKADPDENKQEEFSWDNNDNDGNADSNNNNNDFWGDNANNTQSGNNADNWDNWDTPANNNSGKDENDQSPTVAAGSLSDAPRDLYGPHGPYYALRGLRLNEPQPDAEEEPRFDVPKSLAVARRSTKQVQPGPGYRYYKKRIIPEYIDTLENPYARFVFKYRTKDQILDEIGIEVDVEPTGDAEIRGLQDLDKQALIEMLVRAKGALGGRVPSPPPVSSTQGSEVNAPVTIDAPRHSYLKYSLPPLRPNNINSAKPSSGAANSESKQAGSASKKEDDAGWNNQGNNSGGGEWNNAANNNTTKSGEWGSWDGPPGRGSSQSVKSSTQSAGSQQSHRRKVSASPQSRSGNTTPPRPPTPPKDPAENNWDQAAGTQDAPSGFDW